MNLSDVARLAGVDIILVGGDRDLALVNDEVDFKEILGAVSELMGLMDGAEIQKIIIRPLETKPYLRVRIVGHKFVEQGITP